MHTEQSRYKQVASLTVHEMCRQNDTTIPTILPNHVPGEATAERVHTRSWLIEKHSLALSGKGNCNTELSLHAATQVLGQSVSLFQKCDILDRLLDLLLNFGFWVLSIEPLQSREELNVLLNSEVRKQAVLLHWKSESEC